MPTTPLAPPALSAPAGRLRTGVGALRIAAGLLVLASVVTQIADQLAGDAFVPTEYFSYFTIQTALINVVVLLVGGMLALRRQADTTLFTVVRMAAVAYAIVTAVVYGALLRGLPGDGGFEGIQWPNEVLHVWIPIFIALEWMLAPGRPPLRWTALWAAVSFPLAWVAFTLIRGGITGWYPYPFLQPAGPAGPAGVVAYVLGIAVFIVAVAAAAIAVSRASGRRSPAARGHRAA